MGAVPKDESGKLFLTAKNPHTPAITVSSFGLSYKNKGWGVLWITAQAGYIFPYEVPGGGSIQQWTDVSELNRKLRESGRKPTDLKEAWFIASSGQTYSKRIDKETIKGLQEAFESAPSGSTTTRSERAASPPSTAPARFSARNSTWTRRSIRWTWKPAAT